MHPCGHKLSAQWLETFLPSAGAILLGSNCLKIKLKKKFHCSLIVLKYTVVYVSCCNYNPLRFERKSLQCESLSPPAKKIQIKLEKILTFLQFWTNQTYSYKMSVHNVFIKKKKDPRTLTKRRTPSSVIFWCGWVGSCLIWNSMGSKGSQHTDETPKWLLKLL